MPQVVPVWPTAPMNSALSSGMAPLPFQVIETAAPSRSASAVSASEALAVIAPPPATMTGRRAVSSSSAAASIAAASPTYSLSAQGNMARLEQMIPAQYGRMRFPPDFAAQPYVEYGGNEQYLYQLFCLGVDEYDVEKIDVEDTPITNFAEVTTQIVAPGGSLTLFPSNVITSVEVAGQEALTGVWLGPFVANPAGSSCQQLGVDVLLPADHTPFFRRMNVALQRSIGVLDKRVVVHRAFLPEHKNDVIAQAILNPPYRRRGLILASPDTEPVRQALRTISTRGETAVAVVTNILDVPELKYAGIDNYRAGRAAGYFIGRLTQQSGRVLILSSRTDYQGHVDRTAGCREVLAQYAPRLFCDSRTVETYDDPDRCYLAVSSALKSGEPIVAIYNSGAGSPGIEAALKKHKAADRICWITHEMSDDHREYIRVGMLDMVIDQDPDGQIMTALQHLLHAAEVSDSLPPPNVPTEFRLYFAENIRETPYLP